jgi:hypothetical protein
MRRDKVLGLPVARAATGVAFLVQASDSGVTHVDRAPIRNRGRAASGLSTHPGLGRGRGWFSGRFMPGLACVAALALGCGDDGDAASGATHGSTGGASPSSSTSSAGGSGGSGGLGGHGGGCPQPSECDTPPQCAPLITGNLVASDPPAPENGNVLDGAYDLVASTIYTGVGGPDDPQTGRIGMTLVLDSGKFELSTTTADADGSNALTSGASGTLLLVPGATQNWVTHCPRAPTVDASYTVDFGGALHIFTPLGGGFTAENVFMPTL